MPIDFACSSCGKKYRVADAMAGKSVRCQGCSAVVKVPAGATASVPAKTAAKGAPAKISSADDPFGLGSLGGKEDLFAGAGAPRGGDPLGDPLVEDYGFASVEEQANPVAAEETKRRFAENPVLVEQRKAEEERRRRWAAASENPYMREAEAAISGKSVDPLSKGDGDGGASTNVVLLLMVILLGAASIGTAIGVPDTGFWISLIGMVLCGIIGGIAEIWGIILAFQTSSKEIWKPVLYLLLPPYRLIYWVQNWSVMNGVVMLVIIGFVGSVLCSIGFMIVVVQKVAEEQQFQDQGASRSAASAGVLEA